jgi:hypothetical protein
VNIRCDEPVDEALVAWLGDQGMARRQMEEFRTGRQMKWVKAVNRQHAIAAANQAGEGAIEGMGQHVASIDAGLYYELFGETMGEIWRDTESFKRALADNPMFRVKYQPKAMVTVAGMPWGKAEIGKGESGNLEAAA